VVWVRHLSLVVCFRGALKVGGSRWLGEGTEKGASGFSAARGVARPVEGLLSFGVCWIVLMLGS
jgi:hypothetical protein